MKDNKTLSTAKLRAILDLCSKLKVKSLKYQGLEVEFQTLAPPMGENATQAHETQSLEAHLDKGFVNQPLEEANLEAKVLDTEAEETDKEYLEEIRLTQLMVNDPAAYEQLMIDANLNSRVADDAYQDHRRTESALL